MFPNVFPKYMSKSPFRPFPEAALSKENNFVHGSPFLFASSGYNVGVPIQLSNSACFPVLQIKEHRRKTLRSSISKPGRARYRTAVEHVVFIKSVVRNGVQALAVMTRNVGMRTRKQCRTRKSKYFKRLLRTCLTEWLFMISLTDNLLTN